MFKILLQFQILMVIFEEKYFCRKGVTGAGGENRTHDLPLTKGLRYHYATPATEGIRSRGKRRNRPGAGPIAQGRASGKGAVANNSRVRKERQAAALRENLKRRKARARTLAETGETVADSAEGSSAEPAAAPLTSGPNPAAKNT
jgi:hypothetical protein